VNVLTNCACFSLVNVCITDILLKYTSKVATFWGTFYFPYFFEI
jgi:hypothetical protein